MRYSHLRTIAHLTVLAVIGSFIFLVSTVPVDPIYRYDEKTRDAFHAAFSKLELPAALDKVQQDTAKNIMLDCLNRCLNKRGLAKGIMGARGIWNTPDPFAKIRPEDCRRLCPCLTQRQLRDRFPGTAVTDRACYVRKLAAE